MKILVYGAGPLGSLFAAQLHMGGHEVAILARGQRLSDLREYGIVLKDARTHEELSARVKVVEKLAPDDSYDLILVIMRKNNALDILPILAANSCTPSVLFLMNNAAGPEALTEALGAQRVLLGFPNSAGYREGHVIHVLSGSPDAKALIPIGEVDGSVTSRLRAVARALERAPGLGAEIRTDMDAWLKTHVALLMPSLAAALYASGTDRLRMARTRDSLLLTSRAIREGFKVLLALDIPLVPERYKYFLWLPEPLLVFFLGRFLKNDLIEVALVSHAEAARDEMQHLTDEFLVLARQTDLPTPSIDRLYPYFDPQSPRIPDGSAEIPMDWRGLIAAGATLTGLVVFLLWLFKRERD